MNHLFMKVKVEFKYDLETVFISYIKKDLFQINLQLNINFMLSFRMLGLGLDIG